MSRETPLQQDIRLNLGSDPDMRIFRNNVGEFQNSYGQWVSFGLAPGSADLIGITAVTITPEMVGSTIGVFVSIEVKKQGRYTTEKERRESQFNWAQMVRSLGGRAGVARTVNEARAIAKGRV